MLLCLDKLTFRLSNAKNSYCIWNFHYFLFELSLMSVFSIVFLLFCCFPRLWMCSPRFWFIFLLGPGFVSIKTINYYWIAVYSTTANFICRRNACLVCTILILVFMMSLVCIHLSFLYNLNIKMTKASYLSTIFLLSYDEKYGHYHIYQPYKIFISCVNHHRESFRNGDNDLLSRFW